MQPKPNQVRHINVTITGGGMGDQIASLVAVDYIQRKYPHVRQHVWVPDGLLEIARHLLPDKRLEINDFTAAMHGEFDKSKPGVNTRWDGRISPMKIHLVDYAFQTLCDENPPIEEKNYLRIRPEEIDLSKFRLPEKFAVITTGFTAANREFLPEYINQIAKYCMGSGYIPVFLGAKQMQTGVKHVIEGNFNTDIDYSLGLNLIDRTSLLEAAGIISKASAIIGLDNGLLHIAGCTDTPIIGGFTNCAPRTRMPIRHNVLGWNYYPVFSNEGCNFCQTNLNFVYGSDFKQCFDNKGINTTPNRCLKLLEPRLWTEQLDKIWGINANKVPEKQNKESD